MVILHKGFFVDNHSKISEFIDFSDIFERLSTFTADVLWAVNMDLLILSNQCGKLIFVALFTPKKFLKFYVLHKNQKSFGLLSCFIALGCSMDNPSISHLNSCLVRSFASDALRGH